MSTFDPDLMGKPGETAFQWARRTGQYSELRICGCCLHIEANGEGCHEPCETCDDVGLYEQAYAARPGHVLTLGAVTDDCGHDLSDDSDAELHRESCESFGFTRWPCDLCGSPFHGDRYAATWWPREIPSVHIHTR